MRINVKYSQKEFHRRTQSFGSSLAAPTAPRSRRFANPSRPDAEPEAASPTARRSSVAASGAASGRDGFANHLERGAAAAATDVPND